MLMGYSVSRPASLAPWTWLSDSTKAFCWRLTFPPFFSWLLESLGFFLFFHFVFKKTAGYNSRTERSIFMCKASGDGSEADALWVMQGCNNNQALVKEEKMPRSGGPLDSDLLIRQSLSLLPRATVSFSLIWDKIAACRVCSNPGQGLHSKQQQPALW